MWVRLTLEEIGEAHKAARRKGRWIFLGTWAAFYLFLLVVLQYSTSEFVREAGPFYRLFFGPAVVGLLAASSLSFKFLARKERRGTSYVCPACGELTAVESSSAAPRPCPCGGTADSLHCFKWVE